MRIGPRYNMKCEEIKVNNFKIKWVNSRKYLGVEILSGTKFQLCFKEAKRKFFYAVNSILGNLGGVNSPFVALHLIMSQATPHLLYGINACHLNKSSINSLEYAYNSVFAKLFKTCDNNVIYNCQFYAGYLNFNILYEYNTLTFLKKLVDNEVIKFGTNIDTDDHLLYEKLLAKYNIDRDSLFVNKKYFFTYFEKLLNN